MNTPLCNNCKDSGRRGEKPCDEPGCTAGQRARAERDRKRRETADHPKCKECGNVLGLERAQAGLKRCRGCLPDAALERADRLAKLFYVEAPKVLDPVARNILQELIREIRELR